MQIGIPAETLAGETRVAATPETVKKFAALGCEVLVQAGAGLASSATDAAYEAAGAKVVATAADALANADFVLKVAAPTAEEAALMKQGATVLAAFAPHANPHFDAYAARGLTCVAMELIPRITRAQSSDILSSQANLAGYKAVVLYQDWLELDAAIRNAVDGITPPVPAEQPGTLLVHLADDRPADADRDV